MGPDGTGACSNSISISSSISTHAAPASHLTPRALLASWHVSRVALPKQLCDESMLDDDDIAQAQPLPLAPSASLVSALLIVPVAPLLADVRARRGDSMPRADRHFHTAHLPRSCRGLSTYSIVLIVSCGAPLQLLNDNELQMSMDTRQEECAGRQQADEREAYARLILAPPSSTVCWKAPTAPSPAIPLRAAPLPIVPPAPAALAGIRQGQPHSDVRRAPPPTPTSCAPQRHWALGQCVFFYRKPCCPYGQTRAIPSCPPPPFRPSVRLLTV